MGTCNNLPVNLDYKPQQALHFTLSYFEGFEMIEFPGTVMISSVLSTNGARMQLVRVF